MPREETHAPSIDRGIGSLTGQVLELQEGLLRLGRGDDCALRFDARLDKEVSRRHARIQAEDGDYYIADEQSTNGTLVNGQRVFRQVLRGGDVIELGYRGPRLRVAVEKPPAPPVATPGSAPRAAAAPPVVAGPARPDWRLALTQMTSYNPVLDKGRPDNRTPILFAVGVMLMGAFFTLTMMLIALFEMSLAARLGRHPGGVPAGAVLPGPVALAGPLRPRAGLGPGRARGCGAAAWPPSFRISSTPCPAP